jgi:hypothetical protein
MAALVHKIRPVPSGDDKQRTNSAQTAHKQRTADACKTPEDRTKNTFAAQKSGRIAPAARFVISGG